MSNQTFQAHIIEMANKKLAAMEEEIFRQQAEINRLKTTLKNLKELMLDPDCVGDRGDIYVMVRAIDKALNGESEEK